MQVEVRRTDNSAEQRASAGIDLAVVVPVYNEASVIERVVADLESVLVPIVDSLQVIVVDDASTDETPQRLMQLAASRPWLTVERAPRNRGHGASVLRGLELADSEWIFQLDSDGQVVIGEFARLWERHLDVDLVLGVRTSRRDQLHRRALSHVIAAAVSALCRRRLRDVNTPVRLLRRELVQDLVPSIPPGTLAPNLFVVVGATIRGWRIGEVPITHLPRAHGRSSLRSARLILFSLHGFLQLAWFRSRLLRARRRLRVTANART